MKPASIVRVFATRQFLVFLLVGGTAALVNFSAGALVRTFWTSYAAYIASVTLGFVLGTVVSFVLNRTFTFRASGQAVTPQAFRFVMVALGAVVISVVVASLVLWAWELSGRAALTHAQVETVGHLAAIAVSIVYNFLAMKFFAFSTRAVSVGGVRAHWRSALHAEWISELAFVPLALLLSWCLFAQDGVPWTHDGLGLVVTETYRRAYLAGDWFPTWTEFMAHGHGTAVPLLYHRLHAQLAGLLALRVGTLSAVKASIPMLLVVGAVGMRRLCRYHGSRPWVAWIAGVLLMSANYTVNDWFIRGASAEFAAFMLVPWGLRYAFEVYERAWGAVRLASVSALVFFAHMMTAYFFFIAVAVVMAGGLLKLRRLGFARIRAATWQAAKFGALLVAAIGPYAAAVTYVSEFSGAGGIGMRHDAGAYVSPWGCVIDPDWSWSRAVVESHGSFEIGRWILLCLAVCVVIAPAGALTAWRRAGGLALLAVVFVLLQRRDLSFVFDRVPGAAKIQFPTRLLVFVTTISLLWMCIAVEVALRSSLPFVRLVGRVLPIVAATCQGNVAMGNQEGIWDHLNRSRAFVDEALGDPTDVTTKQITRNGWMDFMPSGHAYDAPEQPFLEASAGCTISSPSVLGGRAVPVVSTNMHLSSFRFTVHGGGCKVVLDQLQSTLLRVDLSQAGRVSEDAEGSTLVEAPDGAVVHVSERSVMDLARKFLIEKTGRSQ